jgi:molybdopterin molybdotransferase
VTLLRVEEARERMLNGVEPLGMERVALGSALGRVLAEPVVALVTLPPWDNSAMDGFAVRAADVAGTSNERPLRFQVIGEVAAGHVPTTTVEPGTAVRILTGGMLPPGADAVVPVEHTDASPGVAELPPYVQICVAAEAGAHIRRAGSDLRKGDRLLEPGEALRPASLAVAAAAGHGAIAVHRRPRVAILGTGDELVPAGEPIGPAQIHDSNSIGLAAQAADAGAETISLGIAGDRLDDVAGRLRTGIAEAEIVIASGGVSVGAHDVVKDAFEQSGRLELWRIAVQPGKPLAYGVATRPDGGTAHFFGLPGNPVSSFVTFELFVRPLLRRLAGHRDVIGRPGIRARLTDRIGSSPGRRTFARVTLAPDPDAQGGWFASLAGGQGSHVLSALAAADGLAVVPEELEGLPAGADVDVIRLDQDCP